MGYDPRSAAVIALCIGSVLVATTLSPAIGMGDVPASADGIDDGRPVSDGSIDYQPSSDPSDSGADGSGSSEDVTDGGSGTITDNGTASPVDEETDNDTASPVDEETDNDTVSPVDEETDNDTASPVDEETDDDTVSPVDDGPDDSAWSDHPAESVPVVLGILALVGIAGTLAFFSRRSTGRSGDSTGESPSGSLPRLRTYVVRIPQLSMIATIGAVRYVHGVGGALATLGPMVATTFSSAGASLQTAFRSVTTLSIPKPRLPAIGWPGLTGRSSSDSRSRGSADRSVGADSAEEGGYAEPDTVEEAWRRLVSMLAVRRPSVRTPRECAAIAIDAGLPRDAVETLTATFEVIRYGGGARTPARLERVREAYTRVREETDGDGR